MWRLQTRHSTDTTPFWALPSPQHLVLSQAHCKFTKYFNICWIANSNLLPKTQKLSNRAIETEGIWAVGHQNYLFGFDRAFPFAQNCIDSLSSQIRNISKFTEARDQERSTKYQRRSMTQQSAAKLYGHCVTFYVWTLSTTPVDLSKAFWASVADRFYEHTTNINGMTKQGNTMKCFRLVK